MASVPLAPAFAQTSDTDTAAEDLSDSPVIIVTARKREENLQDVPITITALQADDLEAANAYGLEDIAELTPGLSYRQVGGLQEVTIRGLAQTDQNSLQSNVGVFIDGIYLNNRSAIEFGNIDLAQVEVLKGPQSSLFGRNTFAGAINYVTNPAKIGEFDMKVEAQLGTHERAGIKGSLNVPVGDIGGIRFFGGWSQFDGTIENERGDDNVGGWDKRVTYGASGLFDFGRVTLKTFYARNEVSEDTTAFSLADFTENSAGTNYVVPDTSTADPNDTISLWTVNPGPFSVPDSVSVDPRARGLKGYYWLAYANLDVDLNFATLTANVSTSESQYSTFFDSLGDASLASVPFGFPAPLGTGVIYTRQFLTDTAGDVSEQDSYELRLASNAGSPFDWLVGFSKYDGTAGGVISTTTPLLADPDTLAVITRVEEREVTEIESFFAAVTIPLGDVVNLSGEIRNTDEGYRLTDEAQIFFAPFLSRPLTFTEADFNYWSGKVSVDAQIADDTLIYAYAARGVKSGGINGGQPVGSDRFTFDPEFNWTYELGTKTTLFGGRALVNAAFFYIDWSNLQVTDPASFTQGPAVVNGSGAKSIGVELDASIDITDNFNLRFAGSYQDATYDDGFIDGSVLQRCDVNGATVDPVSKCSPDVGGNQIANSSSTNLFAAAKYTIPDALFGMDVYARLSYSYESSKSPTSLNLAETGSVQLVNLRYGLKDDKTEIAFWVDNLLNEDYIARISPISEAAANAFCDSCGITSTQVLRANKRTAGLTVSRKF